MCFIFFFKQKTAYEMRISDWSSDVCSSDLTVRHVADRPDQNRDRVAEPRADSIDDPAETDVAERVGDLEPEDDRGEIDLGPAEFFLQCRLEHADHLPIDIVDRRGCEQQAADYPAIAAHALGRPGDLRRRPEEHQSA